MRLLQLDTLPAGFFQDEAVSAVDAWSLLQTGRDHLGHWWPLGAFESFGDWVSPLLIYTQLPSVALLGVGPLGARLPAALAGALAIPVIYAIGREVGLVRWSAALAGLVAALSPWQILRSRVASPPALVPLCWALVLLAGLQLVRQRDRRAALLLALAAGLGLYSYPTMKLAVPLLTACAVLLAIVASMQRDWRSSVVRIVRGWWPAALLVVLLWLPFAQVTLFNQDSGMRASRKFLRADTPLDWVAQWFDGYTTYLRPEFYYLTGDPANGADLGVQLSAELPLVLLGAAAVIWGAIGVRSADRVRVGQYRLVVLAALIAPLPASLMSPNPHLTRALIVAPMYALLVGIGADFFARGVGWKLVGGRILVALLALGMLVQGGMRYADYRERFPVLTAHKYQDGTREAFERAVKLAPSYDEVWVDDQMPFPYIYVLAAGGVPAAEAQATIVVDRPGTTFNTVRQVGKYRFTDVKPIPNDLPALVATVNSLGEPGFLIQEWRADGKRVLLLRRMR
jgi:4-amino-4-deoxy-L-arabinose transferase-like glycosyltransferase